MKLNLPHFLFLNGPSGSGKSTLADLICASNSGALHESFAEPIRSMIYSVFFPNDGPITYQHNLRDSAIKQAQIGLLAQIYDPTDPASCPSLTVRQVMIEFGETYMKRLFGQDVFGRLLFSRCVEQTLFYSHFIIDDSGFLEEAQYIISRVGADACHLVRLHRSDCSFAQDSRGYIRLPGVQALDLHNNSSPAAMLDVLHAELGGLPSGLAVL